MRKGARPVTDRTPFTPTVGEEYKGPSGMRVKCLEIVEDELPSARLISLGSGWTFTARSISRNPDGSIEWWYSYGGHFKDEEDTP